MIYATYKHGEIGDGLLLFYQHVVYYHVCHHCDYNTITNVGYPHIITILCYPHMIITNMYYCLPRVCWFCNPSYVG